VLTKERSIIWKKLVKMSTSWVFDPSLNNPTIEIKRKSVREKYHHGSRTFLGRIQDLWWKNKRSQEYHKSNHDKKEKPIKQVWTQKVV
jgi:hypothetical protein